MKSLFKNGVVAVSVIFSGSLYAKEANKDVAYTQAYELFEVMHLDTKFSNLLNQMLKVQMQRPSITKNLNKDQQKEAYEVTKTFLNKYFGWNNIKDDMAKIYADSFSTDELKEITKFYTTPTGQKMLDKLPKLSREGNLLAQRKLMSHMDELKSEIEKIMEKDKPKDK